MSMKNWFLIALLIWITTLNAQDNCECDTVQDGASGQTGVMCSSKIAFESSQILIGVSLSKVGNKYRLFFNHINQDASDRIWKEGIMLEFEDNTILRLKFDFVQGAMFGDYKGAKAFVELDDTSVRYFNKRKLKSCTSSFSDGYSHTLKCSVDKSLAISQQYECLQ